MANGAAVHGAICTGHDKFPPRPNIESSSNVLINKLGAIRQGDAWAEHCAPDCGCHASVLAIGSSSVYINGRGAARVGDVIACGSAIAVGSGNVFIGG